MANDPTPLVFDQPPVPTPGPVRLAFGADPPAPPDLGVRLVFSQAPVATPGPVRLVFGDDGGTPAIPDATLHGSGCITGLRLHIGLRSATRLSGAGRITGLRLHLAARYDINVSRGGLRAELASHWQQGQPTAAGLGAAWQQAAPLRLGTLARWQQGTGRRAGVVLPWQEAEHLRAIAASHWQQGQPLRTAMRSHWQEAERHRAAVATRWQEAEHRRAALRSHWQDMLRLRAAVASHWQGAEHRAALLATGHGHATPTRFALQHHWQQAMRPLAGVSHPPTPPDPRPPCYDPALPARLVFDTPWIGDGCLVFVCERAGPGLPPAAIVVPARRSYIVINSIEIRRADALAGDPLPSESFQMSLNHQSWTWAFSASFHASARDAVAPGPGGQPVELEVRVNGQPFRLQGERIGRSRRFPEHMVTVSGRGKAAVLDAPHAPVQTFSQALDRTAQQLMAEVLTVNGVGFGWSVDWQLTDWLVPGGIFMHQGTWISALADIAGAVGGYLQPHDTDTLLRVLPLWPKPWWHWDTLAPDIELPGGIAEIDETEVIDLPLYNRIFVAGEAGGIQADLTRSGTGGDMLKQPMAVHPLITTIEAARQRATAELAESGRMLKHKMTLPVLPATGVIKPGTVLRYVDDAQATRLGLVRATAINQQFPVLTQSLEIDSHV